MQIEKTLAVLIVAATLVFVVYNEASDAISGAILYKNEGYQNCYDTDPSNDVRVIGKVTTTRLNPDMDSYATIEKLDECIGPLRVREWECTSYNKPKPIERDTYCPKGTECNNGACA